MINFDCIGCNIEQVNKIIKLLDLSREQGEKIVKAVLGYLSNADYTKSNPQFMGSTWGIICDFIGNEDPYKSIKVHYNSEMLKMYNEITDIIEASPNKFITALKIAITGNLIDFAANYSFSLEELKQKISGGKNLRFDIDQSNELYNKLKRARSLLYIGDNCGEIVLDKIFIEIIKNEFPGINIFYGVRGKPVVNDVTREDARMVEMEKAATVIENGDGSSGTVLSLVSEEFRKIFDDADVIISKGQGNYESLQTADREGIFFLFMAKCELVAELLGVNTKSIVCIEQKR